MRVVSTKPETCSEVKPARMTARIVTQIGQVATLSAAGPVVDQSHATRDVEMHELVTMPSAQNGRVLQAWGRVGAVDLTQVASELRERAKAVINGDTSMIEAMLFDQAVALQAIFTNLSIEAAASGQLSRMEPLLRLALKAQSQSRATLETLGVLKSPPVVFARQANIANGPQQVNNGATPSAPHAPANSNAGAPTELLPRSEPHGG
jgi:hypothetical protein